MASILNRFTILSILILLLLTITGGAIMYAKCMKPSNHLHPDQLPQSYQLKNSGDFWDFTNDAIWFSVQTVTTTGYGSLPWEMWSPKLKFWSSIFMILGIGVWAAAFGELIKRSLGTE